eukprot:gnl/MRDRNA2_/MRDRNA2_128911_c0_seq1.p1 gnl/MRDRNA2_/MRDRNA2_128911_c0~~gnl/MRDRNA2_/MRDRNA2_128911_c0_seq1.p1  ORF type:complete len:247 (+),score=17.53 gnl/MRDRNA2_/MRDRNA2_128911_c0_seq1:50-742(+)
MPAVKKRPASIQARRSKKRQPAARAAEPLPSTTLGSQLPSACLYNILEYAYVGATESIGMYLYVDTCPYSDFETELESSKVPTELRGRVLDNQRVLICSGQLPLIKRTRSVSRSLSISREDLERGSGSECNAFFLFREKGTYLQARSLYREHFTDDIRCLWNDRRWKTIGTVLQGHHPFAVLSRDLSRYLHQIAPCNYRYIVKRYTEIEGTYEFGDHPSVDLMIWRHRTH